MPPRPAADCRLEILDDDGVLLCEGAQTLYALDTTATFLWIGLEEGWDEARLAREFAATFGLSPDRARDDVAATLALWHCQGLLAGSEAGRLPTTRPPADDPGRLELPADLPEPAVRRRYRLLDTGFEVAFASTAEDALVDPVLAHLASSAPAPIERTLRVVPQGGPLLVLRDGVPMRLAPALAGLAPVVKALVLETAQNDHPYLFDIHAGVVAKGDRALLLSAASGQGKSSLTAALVRAGWRYLSDETAPVRPGDLRIRPVPLALALKEGAWRLLQRRYPEIATLPVHDREDGRKVRYLPPPAAAIAPDLEGAYAVRWVVFPAYAQGTATRLVPMRRIEVLMALFEECLSLPGRLDPPMLQRLVAWTRNLQGWRLPNGDLDAACALLDTLPGDV